jgi:hypothetical protein
MKSINLIASVFVGSLIAMNVAHAASLNAARNDLSKRPYTQSSTHEAEQKSHEFEGAGLVRNHLETDAALTHQKQHLLLRASQVARRPY